MSNPTIEVLTPPPLDLNLDPTLTTVDLVVEGADGQPVVLALVTSAPVGLTVETPAPIQLDIVASGPPGKDGTTTAISFTRVSARALSADRVVVPQPDGTVDYADPTDLLEATRPMWLTLTTTGAPGEDVECLETGQVSESYWSWVPGEPIFLGMDGNLTQVAPTADAGFTFLLQVASPDTATDLFYAPRTPYALGE